ncbi:MAG: 5'/3'-nucleotidase SurE [Pseudomonadota bacterium]
MRILITNDDGARADGIKLLERVARTITDDVWVVAPETDQSGVSHAISLHGPLRVHKEDDKRYFVSGTPADCVVVGVSHLLDPKPDLILSGVNHGMNAADSIPYSGTVGAAMTGLMMGIPSIALSQFFRGPVTHWETAEAYAKPLIERLMAAKWHRPIAPNINFPACPPDEVEGIVVCRPASGLIDGVNVEERIDRRGLSYFWLQFTRAKDAVEDPDTDYAQLKANKITITPLRNDAHATGDWEAFADAHGDTVAVAL